jgi:hypothetical protein
MKVNYLNKLQKNTNDTVINDTTWYNFSHRINFEKKNSQYNSSIENINIRQMKDLLILLQGGTWKITIAS